MKEAINILRKALGEPEPSQIRRGTDGEYLKWRAKVAEQEYQLLNQPEHKAQGWVIEKPMYRHAYRHHPTGQTITFKNRGDFQPFPTSDHTYLGEQNDGGLLHFGRQDWGNLENKVKAVELYDHQHPLHHIIHKNPEYDPNANQAISDAMNRGARVSSFPDSMLRNRNKWVSSTISPHEDGTVKGVRHHASLRSAVMGLRGMRADYGYTTAITNVHYHDPK